MSITFVTGNLGKFEEVKSVIPELLHADIDLPEIQELDSHVIIQAKLDAAILQIQGGVIVEDTSLQFEGMYGLPGPLIKWFIKAMGNENLYGLTEKLENNKATATTVFGYAKENGETAFFHGEIHGTIVSPKGTNGFGFDPIFQPEGYDKTFGEMTPDEKKQVSARAIAAQKLAEFLQQ